MRGRRPVWAALLGVVALASAACSGDEPLTTPDGSPISTTVTRVAEVNIVSADRDFSKTCLAPTPADAGTTDAARIVVTDPALLDALCALGIGDKVTAVTAAPGSVPAYLGPQLTAVPAIGTTPDAAAVSKADADLVLTTPGTAPSSKPFGAVRSVTIPAGDWQKQFRAVADAVNRSDAGRQRLAEFTTEATKTGRRMDASHTQVSLVRFGDDSETIAGMDTFAGQILGEIGVQRPGPQRVPDSFPVDDADFREAEGDLIYVSFEGEQGQKHGEEVLLSDEWLNLGASMWKRVLAVDDAVWYDSSGLAAAWLVLNDVKGSLDGNS
ncbi:ABC transporter substrate-binding protein [Gordonia amicalis]|uniref:ABC transporter substrate-binding protein n=1 Tax=Gordonia amicalis TaxID=89053 RepID=UPI0005865830|nr:ABC transporter substrate-binding protein [Gordonia amicalis]MBA5846773.1 ABC transporter substrate-binding protein [Gordonia amicalis]MDV7175754.1 ABC transporter substrate-binding protein [Gordonia amicalis]NKX77913.1 ABC transporter substrate-binding protein [Gordonia amicalis]UOG23457.1 ABC transporter substrate-binding protein [Gordonia amicalis]